VSKITFNNKKSPFYRALKEKVDGYFSNHNLHPAGNGRLLRKSLFQVASALVLYVVLVFFTPGLLLSVLLCGLLGLNLAAIGFNVMHEGGHQSFSRHKWLNQVSAYALNGLGASSYYWKVKHNINHHTYTNIEGLDSDINVRPFMRLNESQPRRRFHRFQHLYWVFLYSISYLAWVFYHDFEKYFSGRIALGTEAKKLPLREHLIFWLTKAGFLGVYLVLPVLMIGLVPALIGFLIVTFVCGLFISVVFQLAHVVENTHFPSPDEDTNRIEQEWALHQVSTTSNFATRNRFISWVMGGLNFQVEHHLFPRVSHVHYPKISELVRETCREFNVAYLEYPSMRKAIRSHLLHLKSMGRPQPLLA
jgi:linoleoyl-CoA desaturase